MEGMAGRDRDGEGLPICTMRVTTTAGGGAGACAGGGGGCAWGAGTGGRAETCLYVDGAGSFGGFDSGFDGAPDPRPSFGGLE